MSISSSWIQKEQEQKQEFSQPEFRTELRKTLLGNSLIDGTSLTTISAYFDGYGDSGQIYDALRPDGEYEEMYAKTNAYMCYLVENHVDWDWYNNEGGGGEVVWDLQSDKITINGYYNVTESVDQDEIVL